MGLISHRAKRYEDALRSIPAPGSGCHPYLLKVANIGVRAGLDAEIMIREIAASIPSGKRSVPRGEVRAAVERAQRDASSRFPLPASDRYAVRSHSTGPVIDAELFFDTARRGVSERFALDDYEAELWEVSQIRMHWEPHDDAAQLLRHLYGPDDFIFIGERQERGIVGKTIRRAGQWIEHIECGGPTAPHILPNPLTGLSGTTKNGKPTLRGDACVKIFRYAVVEFDEIPKEEQAAFFMFVNLPIAVIIDSGGKSLHAWIRIDAPNAEVWTREVEHQLFDGLLKPLGVDSACKNEARMSRLPGHLRDTGNRQKILYLAPEGRPIPR